MVKKHLCVRSGERVEKHGWELRVEITGVRRNGREDWGVNRKRGREEREVQAITRAYRMMMEREEATARDRRPMR